MDRELTTTIRTIYDATGIQAYQDDLSAARSATEQLQQGLAATGQTQFAVAGVDEATAEIAVLTGEVEGAGAAIADASGQTFTANGADTAAAEFRDVADAAQEVGDEVESAEGKSRGFGETLDGIVGGGAKTALLGIAGITAAYKVLGAVYDTVKETIRESLDLYEVQAQAEAQLEQRLTATGYAAGASAEEIYAHASALQEVTRIGDEAIIPAQSMLLTFKNIKAEGGIFDRATETVLDLATAMNSGATPSMSQLVGQSVQLGKALNDPLVGLTALTRVGVSFTDAQKETIRTLTEMGDVAAAQTIILDELEAQYGGSAAAAAETFAGKQEQLSNTVGDVKEAIGDLLAAKAEPFLEWLMTGQDEAAELTERLRGTADAIRDVGTLRDEYRKLTGNEFSASRAAYGAANASLLSDIFGYGVSDRQELELLIEALDRLKGYELFTTDYVDDHYTELEAAAEAAAKLEEQMNRLTTSYEDGEITLSEYTRKLALFNGLTDAEGLLTEKGVTKLQGMVGAYGSSSYAADEYYARQQAIL
ncbi:MAG: hypothetical protein M9918_24655, partial [Anaerolineae bacterium]|nr:hypothetical protein [Anaerolineae bacterium]